MRSPHRAALAGLVLLAAPAAAKKPAAPAPAKKPVAPAAAKKAAPLPPLPFLPSIARVKIVHHGGLIAVTEEVSLPRGEWKGQDLRFHVAFGAPGPRAIDAHLVPVADGALEPEDDVVGEALPVERAPRRPGNAYALIGRETMAGVVVHVRAESLKKALEPGNMASLRIRSVVEPTEPDTTGATSVVVRLGVSRGTPLTLGRIVASSAPSAPALARAEARLCGPEADPHPLAVKITPPAPRDGEPVIAPVLSVRRATDDLCVRLWTAPK